MTLSRFLLIVKITSKRQVTLPARVLDALGVGPGDQLEIVEGPDGFALKPRRIDHSRLGRCTIRSGADRGRLTSRTSGSNRMTLRFGIDTSVRAR